MVDGNCRRVAARQGLDIADIRAAFPPIYSSRSPSDHVITIMSSSAISRARLRWVNDEDTAVQLLDAERLENNLADLVARQAETSPGPWRSFSRCRCAAP